MSLINQLRNNLDPINHPFTPKEGFKPAAVLIPIFTVGETILFTKRTEHVRHHQGQISFPGGRYELGDENLMQTALRETNEEVGIEPIDIEVIGRLQPTSTISNHFVHPFIGLISKEVEIKINPDEVAEHFFVPLKKILDPSTIDKGEFEGETRSYFRVDDYKIWGITAGILKKLILRLN